jgi:hypothetical protein
MGVATLAAAIFLLAEPGASATASTPAAAKPAAPRPPEAETGKLYMWTDESGQMHVVDSLAMVPESQRAEARANAIGSGEPPTRESAPRRAPGSRSAAPARARAEPEPEPELRGRAAREQRERERQERLQALVAERERVVGELDRVDAGNYGAETADGEREALPGAADGEDPELRVLRLEERLDELDKEIKDLQDAAPR